MRIAVIGSRSLKVDVSEYIPSEATEIISGGAVGIDLQAEAYADEHNIPKQIIRPEYSKYKKAAPLKRNELIVNMSDLIIAIWNGTSYGTKYVIDYAKEVGKPVEIHIISQNKKTH